MFVISEFNESFLKKIEYAGKLYNFVTRTLKYFDFCARKSTISQSIPKDWKDLVIADAARVRKKSKRKMFQSQLRHMKLFCAFINLHLQYLLLKVQKEFVHQLSAMKKKDAQSWYKWK